MDNPTALSDDVAVLVRWVSRVPARLAGFIWEAIALTLRMIFERKPLPVVAEPVIETVNEAELDESERETRSCVPSAGFVYTMLDEETGEEKLGHTCNSVATRRSHILSLTGKKLKITNVWESENAWAAEKILHSMFANKNTHGEYFKLDDADIAMIPDIIEAANPANIIKRIKAPKTVTCGACGAVVEV